MNTWSPIFSSIVESSIWDEPDYVCKIFVTMLALKDADHVVRYTAYQLANRSKKTEKEVLDALKLLSAPDKRRIEKQEFDGRRIEKVEDGWLMLNGEKYRELMKKVSRRFSKAEWARKNRAEQKQNGAVQVAQQSDDDAAIPPKVKPDPDLRCAKCGFSKVAVNPNCPHHPKF